MRPRPTATSPAAPAQSILDLPDELLSRCFQPLSQQDRFARVALVCKHFSHVCLSAALLRGLEISPSSRQTVQTAQLEALLRCCSGSLEELEILGEAATPPSLAFLPHMTALQRLELSPAHLTLPRGCTGLRSLKDACLQHLFGPAHLPSSLTALDLRAPLGFGLPAQLSRLTALARLSIFGLSGPDPGAGLDVLLPHLSALTGLRMEDLGEYFTSLPPSIAALPCLERLSLYDWQQAGPGGAPVPPLPAGPWLSSLRWLGLPWAQLAASAALLASSAPYLEHVGCLGMRTRGNTEVSRSRWQDFWSLLLAQHPSLRCLSIESRRDSLNTSAALLDAVIWLKARRPELLLRRASAAPGAVVVGSFFDIVFDAELPAGCGIGGP